MNHKIFSLILSAFVVVLAHARIGTNSNLPKLVNGEFVVHMGKRNSLTTLEMSLVQNSDFKIVKVIDAESNVLLLKSQAPFTQSDASILRLKALLRNAKSVEPNWIFSTAGGSSAPNPLPPPPQDDPPVMIPNDPNFDQLWGMHNIGQLDSSGREGFPSADSAAAKAWSLLPDAREIVVAVIDTGVDYRHPDLQTNMWTGKGPGGEVIYGYNAIDGRLDPMDDNGHGTHCAGTIGAVANNRIGVAGVAWNVRIMGIKFLSASGGGTLADAIAAINWARRNGAQIMSNSWGAPGIDSPSLESAIDAARQEGVVFVAAAGNNGESNDKSKSQAHFPASFDLDNIVSVASSNNRDELSEFSNFGRRSVDLMAPGENIYSTVPGATYSHYSGTSMATPHVSGALALLLAQERNLSPVQMRQRLVKGADKIRAYSSRLASSGRLNIYRTLKNLNDHVR